MSRNPSLPRLPPHVIAHVLAASLAAATGCAASPSDAKTAGLGESFSLKVGEVASIHGESLEIGFDEVANDSRCPEGERCVWEGDAVVRIWLRKAGGTQERRELHTSSRQQGAASDGGYDVRLERLEPKPAAGKTIEQREYVATLRVARE